MEKVFANIDYIVGVKVYYEKLTEYEFKPFEEQKVKYIFFGLIPKLISEKKPDRWLKPVSRDTYHSWLTDKEVREWKRTYRIQEHPKKLFKNAYIEIRYLNKHSSFVYFKSDQELDAYIDNLKNKMGNKLILIRED